MEVETIEKRTMQEEKDKISQAIKEKLGICPYYKTEELLCEVWIQKRKWGGTYLPENIVKMSMRANEKYMQFVEERGIPAGSGANYFEGLYVEFLQTTPNVYEANAINALKGLVTMRIQFEEQALKFEAIIRTCTKRLDEVLPLSGLKRSKRVLDYFSENEKLQKTPTWQNLGGACMTDMLWAKTSFIEKEIEAIVKELPIWKLYGDKVPGLGAWLTGYFIAVIQNPLRFTSTRKLRGYFGLRNADGVAQKRKIGETANWNARGKMMLLGRYTSSVMKQISRFPNHPYAKLYHEVIATERAKAENTNLAELAVQHKCEIADIENLGFKNETDEDSGEVTQKFQGYKIKRAGKKTYITLTPTHVWNRINRKFGNELLSDFYRAWLYTMGELDDTDMNSERKERLYSILQS